MEWNEDHIPTSACNAENKFSICELELHTEAKWGLVTRKPGGGGVDDHIYGHRLEMPISLQIGRPTSETHENT